MSMDSITSTSARSDGTTLVNGKPFFPFGFFNISDAGRTFDQLMADVTMIGAAGFNIMHVIIWEGLTLGQWQQLYSTAVTCGVAILGQISPTAPANFVATMKDHQANFGWYIWDDVQDSTDFAALAKADYQTKQEDFQHVTNAACLMARLKTHGMQSVFCDTFGAESYPIGNNELIDSVHGQVALAVAAAAKNQQSPYGYLQTFDWHLPGSRPPTAAEYRCMAYQAIIAGAKGIINYTWFDGQNYLPNYAELWAGVKAMPAEVLKYTDYFLNGVRSENQFSTPSPAWYGTWTNAGKTLVIAVNAGTVASIVAPIRMPGITDVRLSTGVLVVNLAPLEVAVYEFQGTVNRPPTWVQPATGTLDPQRKIALAALADDDGGATNLKYSWGAVGTQPGPVSFDTPGFNRTSVYVTAPGTYTFRVTARDAAGLAVSSDVKVVVP